LIFDEKYLIDVKSDRMLSSVLGNLNT